MFQAWVLVSLLFFLPLLVIPSFALAFETPKVILAQLLIEVLIIWRIFKGYKIETKGKNIQMILLGGLILLSVIQLIIFPKQVNLFGNVFRLQGLLLLWHLVAFSLISGAISLKNIPKVTYLISFLAIFLSTFILGENRAGRTIGTLGEPNALAATITFILPFAFFATKNRLIKAGAFLCAFMVVLLAKSASGLLALTLISIFFLLTEIGKINLKIVVGFCLLILGIGLFGPILGFEKLNVGGAKSNFKLESRAEIWQTAYLSGFKSPILGSGFGSITNVLKQTSKEQNSNLQYQFIDSSHNLILDYWVQAGILGVLIILSLVSLTLKNLIQKKDHLKLAAFLAVLTTLSFNPMSIGILLSFWWLIGQTEPN